MVTAVKLNILKGDRTGIEDRRYLEPVLQPREADSLVRGLPQTPAELIKYKQMLERIAAYKRGEYPVPEEEFVPGLGLGTTPSQGDPAGIEAARMDRLRRLHALLRR